MEDIKQIDTASIKRAEQLREAEKPRPKAKEGKSPFDDLLEQSRKLQEGSVNKQTAKNTVTKEATAEAEKYKERQRDKSKDSEKEEERKQDQKGEKREGSDGAKKVFGKAGLKQQQEGGGDGAKGDGGLSGRRGRQSLSAIKKLSLSKEIAGPGQNGFAKELQNRLAQSAQSHNIKLPQDVLNQIVQAARLGIARDGSKTLELDCHQELFNGLKLRFKSRGGKVRIEFLTSNPETRELFKKEAAEIQKVLREKGIDVEELHVV